MCPGGNVCRAQRIDRSSQPRTMTRTRLFSACRVSGAAAIYSPFVHRPTGRLFYQRSQIYRCRLARSVYSFVCPYKNNNSDSPGTCAGSGGVLPLRTHSYMKRERRKSLIFTVSKVMHLQLLKTFSF